MNCIFSPFLYRETTVYSLHFYPFFPLPGNDILIVIGESFLSVLMNSYSHETTGGACHPLSAFIELENLPLIDDENILCDVCVTFKLVCK